MTSDSNLEPDRPGVARLFCIGLSHQTADLALREKIHISPAALGPALDQIRNSRGISEAVILSTCNRFEIYALNGQEELAAWLTSRAPNNSAILSERLTTRWEKDTVKHLFSVAAGLEAQVIGETQILGQVKEAYESAKLSGMTGQTLNMLFQRALTVGKRIRTETKLAETPISISSVAVRLCEKIFGLLAGRKVLVVGAGEISCLAAEQLFERGARLSIFSTRSREPAQILARTVSAACYEVDALGSHLPEADIVISGSGAPHLLLTESAVREAQKKRKGRPLFLVDLAMPRDIDPESAKMENVFLYNLDDLDEIANDHRKEREREIPKCVEMVREETDAFWDKLNDAILHEPLQRFHAKISGVVEEELHRSGISGERLESLKKSIPNRILSEAFRRSRGEFSDHDRTTLLNALKQFFGL